MDEYAKYAKVCLPSSNTTQESSNEYESYGKVGPDQSEAALFAAYARACSNSETSQCNTTLRRKACSSTSSIRQPVVRTDPDELSRSPGLCRPLFYEELSALHINHNSANDEAWRKFIEDYLQPGELEQGTLIDGIDEYAEYAALDSELLELATSRKQRRPTFIETSQAEWDEVRPRLDVLYQCGMDAMTHYPDLVERPGHCNDQCSFCGDSESVVLSDVSIYIVNIGPRNISAALCMACGEQDDPVQLMRYGLFPISPKKKVYIQFETLDLLSVMTNFNPLLSYVTIVNALNFNSKKRRLAYNLRPEVFNSVIREWKILEEKSLKTDHNLFQCPACGDEPHAVHIDGNAKLYRYRNAAGVSEIETNKSELILEESEVQQEVDSLRSRNDIPEVDPLCGDTTLRTARTGGKAHKSKDETGLMLATCRHVFVLKALDMKRGEIYEYPYILQKEFPTARYIAHDTVCKYWPWLEKLDGLTAHRQKPILSVMHAKSHIWTCQMKWGAKVIEGAGRSTGETTEQANSYLSRLGPVTRNSHKAVRRERITQSSAFWNARKLLDLPDWIRKSLKKMLKEISELEVLLTSVCAKTGKDETDLQRLAKQYTSIGEGTTCRMEKNLEVLACKYQRLAPKVLSVADGSKARSKIRAELSDLNEKYTEAVKDYVKANPKTLSKRKLMQCRDTLKFPWTKGNQIDLSPGVVAAVEVWQLLQRNREELAILKQEREKLISYVTQVSKRGGDSWLTEELIMSVKDKLIHGQCHVEEFFPEPEFESDVEGDD